MQEKLLASRRPSNRDSHLYREPRKFSLTLTLGYNHLREESKTLFRSVTPNANFSSFVNNYFEDNCVSLNSTPL
ncbi:unnamed protein product [Cyprideis torosa]|uniref:Uncharacterized protein n=1 Tax=Cyprideis torosa TaxID=163714 RepID=A0A7R8ZNM1_9CRUS|nr:unnamed protein product [Cyprideis torosa]CAG0886677.1 unnamed protein product [Cyprideis torosa]